jgi:hypothetical protein
MRALSLSAVGRRTVDVVEAARVVRLPTAALRSAMA